MNILVINPPNKPFTNSTLIGEPLDVLQIATVIKERFSKINVLDMDVLRMENNINQYLEDENIIVFVYDYQIPLHTSATINNIYEIIRNLNKKAKVIMIGKTSSYIYKDFLENGIDIVIKGIAEDFINDVISNVNNINKLKNIPNLAFKDKGKIIITKQVFKSNNYSKLPIVERDFIDLANYMDTRTIITSRGCNGCCKFCTTPYFFRKWNGKSARVVVKEIEVLVKKYKAKQIMFLDDNAIVNKERMLRICELIKKKNLKCLFGVLGSIKCYDRNLLKTMYSVGFRWIHFGLESGSSKILNSMNKNMDIAQVKEIIKEVKQMGYRVRTSFILDYPGTTKEDLNKTRELLGVIKPHEVRLHYLAYRYGTPIKEEFNILNNTQYIHSNKPNVFNLKIIEEVKRLVIDLKEYGYEIITDDIDWNKYNNQDKNVKIASFVPIKYGMCWYE